MMTVTVNGTSYAANWCWAPRTGNTLRLEIMDGRALYEIARDFENAYSIEKISAEEGNLRFVSNGRVLRILRPDAEKANVEIILERGEKVEYNAEQNG